MPPWIADMIAAMADYVHAGCTPEEAARIGAHVGAVGATLYWIKNEEGTSHE